MVAVVTLYLGKPRPPDKVKLHADVCKIDFTICPDLAAAREIDYASTRGDLAHWTRSVKVHAESSSQHAMESSFERTEAPLFVAASQKIDLTRHFALVTDRDTQIACQA